MKKSVRILAIILVVIMLAVTLLGIITPIFAAEPETKTSFSLEEAISYAKTNNAAAVKNNLKSKELYFSLNLAESSKRDLEKQMDALAKMGQSTSAVSNVETYRVKAGYYELLTRQGSELFDVSKKVQDIGLEITIETSYNDVVIKERKFENAKSNYSVITKQLEYAKTKLDLGMISELEYRGLVVQQKAAETSMISAENDYKKAMMDLNENLGLQVETMLTLTTKDLKEPKVVERSDSKLEEVKKINISLIMAQNDLKAAEMDMKLTYGYYGSGNNYSISKSQFEQKELDLKTAEIALEKSLISKYMDIDVMYRNLEILKESVEINKLLLGVTQIRRDSGTATEIDVIKASMDLLAAENNYLDLLNGYNALITSFENNII